MANIENSNEFILFKNKPNYDNLKLEKQLQNLYIDYIKYIEKDDCLKALNSILHIIFKLKMEENPNFNLYFMYLCILIFHKRQFKNNKLNPNSKDIFYETILMIYDYEPNIIKSIIYNDLIGIYGYYNDYINIWKLVIKNMKTNYNIKSGVEYKNIFFNHFFKKYNPLIVSIVSILNYKKEKDLKTFDIFLKNKYELMKNNNNSNNSNNIELCKNGLCYLIHNSHKNSFIITSFFNSLYLNFNYDITLINENILYISKIGMWLPREGKHKNLYWYILPFKRNKSYYNNIKGRYRKYNCFDYIVLFNKISYCNFTTLTINNSDRKKYRITSSILNILIETPQISMCKNKFQNINFNKCGSKFIVKNKTLFNVNNKKKHSLWNKIDKNKCKVNLIQYLEREKNKSIQHHIINNLQENKQHYNKNLLVYFNNKDNDDEVNKDYNCIKEILNSNFYNCIYTIINNYYLFEK